MNAQTNLQNLIILLLLSFVWGSSFILMKKALISFTGLQVGSLRIAIAFLFFLPYAIKVIASIPKDKLKYIAAIGLVGSFLPAFLYAIAQTKLDSAPTGILNSLTPLTTYIWGIFVFHQTKSSQRFMGIIIGLIGATILIVDPQSTFGINAYALLVVLATIFYGLSGNIAKTYLQDVKASHITAVSFCFVGIPAIIIAFATSFTSVLQTDPKAWQSLGYIAILAIVGTALALVLFWKLIQKTDALFGSITTYIIPIVAIGWGLLDGEKLVAHQYIGFLLIIVSVFLVKKQPKVIA